MLAPPASSEVGREFASPRADLRPYGWGVVSFPRGGRAEVAERQREYLHRSAGGSLPSATVVTDLCRSSGYRSRNGNERPQLVPRVSSLRPVWRGLGCVLEPPPIAQPFACAPPLG